MLVTAIVRRAIVRRAVGLGLGLVDGDIAAFHVGAVETSYRGIGLGIVGHFHETEALGLTAESVADQANLDHFTEPGKSLAQIGISDGVREVSYVYIHNSVLSESCALVGFDTIEKNQAQNSFESGAVVSA